VQRGKWGVSDPHLSPPDFAPGAAQGGSLTPQVDVAFVRENRAASVTPSGAPVVYIAHRYI